jgi:hypothetical protein
MREIRPYGSVRGAPSNGCPYRDPKRATGKIDILQLHNVRDPAQDLAELGALKTQGLCRYTGITTTSEGSYSAAEAILRRAMPDFLEIDYAIDNRDAEQRVLPAARDAGTAVLAALPFGRGRLFRAALGKKLPDFAAEIDCVSWGQFFSEIHAGPPGGHRGDSGHRQARAYAGQSGRRPWPAARRRHARPHGKVCGATGLTQSQPSQLLLARLLGIGAHAAPQERRAALLSFACNFVLLGSYYILRPLRDTMATVFGVNELQNLYTGTFVLIFLAAPLFSWIAARVKLSGLLPGVFWVLLVNLLIFYGLFHVAPHNRWSAAAYFCWFSAINLILISVFWTLMADVYSASQATRFYSFIAAGGSLGAICGPLITRAFVERLGVDGLLLIAIAGFCVVLVLVHLVMGEKPKLRARAVTRSKPRSITICPAIPFAVSNCCSNRFS